MATDKQAAANRRNALHSTGPRTAEGKARSSQNAVTHGLNCAGFIVTEDRRQEFESLRAELIEQHQPVTAAEWQVFQTLLHAAWGQKRVWWLEAELFDGQSDPLADPELERQMDRYARYAARFERSYYRALKELRQMKTNGDLRHMLPTSTAGEMSDLSDAGQLLRAKRSQKGSETGLLDMLMAMDMPAGPGFGPSAGWPGSEKSPKSRKPPSSFVNK